MKTLILKMIVFLWILNLLTNFINFSFSRNRLNTFPWWYATDIMPFHFVWGIYLYSLMKSEASSALFTFSAFSFNSPVSIVSLFTRIYQLLIYLFFVESLLLLNVFRTFTSLKTKNNQYTINLKHPLQTKMQLRWAQNASFSTRLRVVKVLYHEHFCKTLFQIKLISKNKKS